MRPAGHQRFQSLLPVPGDLAGGTVPDAGAGPAMPRDPFLRVAADGGLLEPVGNAGKPEVGATTDAGDGVAGHLPAT